jgi:hypothetical protein
MLTSLNVVSIAAVACDCTKPLGDAGAQARHGHALLGPVSECAKIDRRRRQSRRR